MAPASPSRREFLIGRFAAALVARPTEQARRRFPVLRPPGAIEEGAFLAACTRCDACFTACPHGAVQRAPATLRGAENTPIVDPTTAPCRMCADAPCVTSCEAGALRREALGPMGRARVQRHDCLEARGSPCGVCVERCPVPGAMEMRAGVPVVNEDACTGCGVCQYVCLAPQNAILILPAASRPNPPRGAVGPEGSRG